MADNETSYLPIGTCLEQIEKAVYGREVRKAIHDGIAQCYDDTVEGVNAAQQAASDTQEVIDNAIIATREANTAAAEASNVKVEQTVSGDTVTFTTTKRDGTTVSTSFQKPNIVVSKDEGSGEFSVTATGWNGEEIIAKIPDPSEEVKSRATIAAVSKVKTALGNPLTITDGMDAPAVKTVVTLEPKQDLHGYDHPWVGGSGKNLYDVSEAVYAGSGTMTVIDNGIKITATNTNYPSSKTSAPFAFLAGVTYALSGHVKANAAQSNYRPRLCVRDWSSNSIKHAIMLPANNSEGDVRVIFTPSEAFDGYVSCLAGGSANNESIDVEYTFIQLELGDTVTAYEPYSNICPIEGYDTVRVTATGKNLAVKAPASLNANIYNAANLIPVKAGETIYVYGLFTSSATTNMQAKIFSTKDVTSKTANVVKDLGLFISGATATFAITNDGYFGVTYYAGVLTYTIDKLIISREPIVNPDEFADPNTTSLSVAQAAGATVYGGTVTLNEDGSGTLVVDRGIEVITKDSPIGKGMKDTVWYLNKTMPMAKLPDYRRSLICDTVEVRQNHSAMTNNLYNVPGITGYGDNSNGYPNSNWIYFTDGKSTTNADIVAWLTDHPLSVVYPLRTITTYTLTADQLRTLTGENHVWTDGTKLELTYRADKYADVEKFLNAIPTGTKTGDPAVFADGADDLPFEKLTIAVEPHQEGSGDPSPDNIRPITGWDEVKVTRCGKNLFDPNVEDFTSLFVNVSRYGHKYTKTGQYTITVASDGSNAYYKVCETDLSDFSSITGGLINAGRTVAPSVTEGKMLMVYVEPANVSKVNKIFVALGNNVEYEDYIGSTLPISLKYATGSTVYGGTVTINRDGTGSVVVDRAMKTYTSGWGMASSVLYIEDLTVPIDSHGVMCNQYACNPDAPISAASIAQNYPKKIVSQSLSSGGNHTRFLVYDTTYATAYAFNAHIAASPIQIVYKLATPTTYTLTAPQLTSLLGNNTVWCDAGQVTVKYKRDIGKALDAMVASLIEAGLYVDMGAVDVVPDAVDVVPGA